MRLSALTSRARIAVAAATVAVAASLAAPSLAHAAPAPTQATKVDQRTLDSLGAFAPAIIGSVTTPGPDGKVNAQLLQQARAMADQPGLPPPVSYTHLTLPTKRIV